LIKCKWKSDLHSGCKSFKTLYMVQRPLKTEGTEEVEERKKDLATQVEGGRREEKHTKYQLWSFGV